MAREATRSHGTAHSNGSLGILLEDGGNGGGETPTMTNFDVAQGVMAGVACPNCTVEIYSDSAHQGEHYETSLPTGEDGWFEVTGDSPFRGPRLTATATGPDGSTSAFSAPTVGTKAFVPLQQANDTPYNRLSTLPSDRLPDNRIGSLWDLTAEFFEGDLEQFVREVSTIGLKWIRLLLDYGDFPQVDWTWRDASTQLTLRQIEAITLFANAGIPVMCGLVFWDTDSPGKMEQPGYSRFRTEGEIHRYVTFVAETVRRLRGLVTYYEILNEPNIGHGTQKSVQLEDYVELVEHVLPVIRQEDPQARVVVGATASFREENTKDYLFGILQSSIMPLVNGVSFHPMYGTSPCHDTGEQVFEGSGQYYYRYPELIRQVRETAEPHGFRGEIFADELTWRTSRNPNPYEPWTFTDIVAAKYYARGTLATLGLDAHAGIGGTEPGNPLIQMQVVRNLCTVMAGNESIDMPVEIDINFEPTSYCAFRCPNGDRILAVWTDGIAQNEDPGVPATIKFPGLAAGTVTGIDVLHGFEQDLVFETDGEATIIRDLLVKDYPILIRLSNVTMSPGYEETVGDRFHRLGEPGDGSISESDSDRDGDGVPDDEDYCPDWPGSKEANGC